MVSLLVNEGTQSAAKSDRFTIVSGASVEEAYHADSIDINDVGNPRYVMASGISIVSIGLSSRHELGSLSSVTLQSSENAASAFAKDANFKWTNQFAQQQQYSAEDLKRLQEVGDQARQQQSQIWSR